MEASIGGGLLSFLAEIPDPRSRHGRRHRLSAILALVCGALMSGARSYAAIGPWGQDQDITLRHRLGFTRRPPKAGGIRKVLIAWDVKAFEAALTRWAETNLRQSIPRGPAPLEAFALDGKSARGSFDGLEKAVHRLSLRAHGSGLTPRSDGRARRRRGNQRAQDGAAVARRGGPGGARGHRRRPLLPARPLPAGHRRPGALPVVRQGEPTDPPGRHRGGLRPFRGRGFFPLGSGGPGRKRWRPRRPSTRGMAGANAGR